MNKKSLLIPILGLSALSGAQAAITFTPTVGSFTENGIVDVEGDSNVTTYSGTWSESETSATGTWSIDIEYTSSAATALDWEANAGNSVAVGATTGGGLLLDFRGADEIFNSETSTLDMSFTMAVDSGYSLTGLTYGVGPSGNGSFADWGTATINTGGTLVPGTASSATYDSVTTGDLTPTVAGAPGTSTQDWYISYSVGTTITWSDSVQARDTHVFGASGVTVVPEPSSTLLIGLGFFSFMLRRRR
ncbi:MAG: PEP-CTERM sorting domain-containing protein [Verrucomicrobiae bacterium]|nr:PEP-CTERM sorting domain-containing protein [Verrucomicrobiae bacterium]NNJ42738.1 PEP-CTERM sorting domain-containing protein [Akkermansiaceae bacterium]